MQPKSLFTKIIEREIPAEILLENQYAIVIRDIQPQAPVHLLVVPKQPVQDLTEVSPELMGQLLLMVQEVVRQEGLKERGFRVVVNNGAEVGQSVFHLHLHVLSGRSFTWPPG